MDNIEQLNDIFNSFKIKAECINFNVIRNISSYDVSLSSGTRVRDLEKFSQEIAMALRALNKPLIKVIPKLGIVQMQFSNNEFGELSLLEEYPSVQFQNEKSEIYLGNSTDNSKIIIDIEKLPHLLIAGTSGSGKSVLLHNIVYNLLLKEKTKLFIVDTKNIEFSDYSKLKNVDCSTTYTRALEMLEYIHDEMEWRYEAIQKNHNIKLSNVVVLIDEFADIIAQDKNDKFYKLICLIAQKSRAANIFCIVATQRPSVDVIKGLIKANFPARISCKVASNFDSRIILNTSGAELLSGNGDAIINSYNHNYTRFQVGFVSKQDILDRFNGTFLSNPTTNKRPSSELYFGKQILYSANGGISFR